jgi:phenylacetate-CoA ligase
MPIGAATWIRQSASPGASLDRAALAALRAHALLRSSRHRTAATPSTRASSTRRGVGPADLRLPEDLARLPLTTKAELVADQEAHPPWGTALTEPLERYTRYCQTSSTTGRPMRWIDTNESWQWLLDCWKAVFRAAQVRPGDRVFFPFSFGPFLGFWSGSRPGRKIGLHCIPGGGMSSHVRLATIEAVGATVVCCTPTYALRLAEVARRRAGRTAALWPTAPCACSSWPESRAAAFRPPGAHRRALGRARDRSPRADRGGPGELRVLGAPGGLHVNEGEFMCEVLDPATQKPVPDGQPGELVVTNLGRSASPVIRYRTGDMVVRPHRAVRLRAHVGAARGRHPGARRRHGEHPGRERLSRPASRRSCGASEVVEFRSTVSRAGPALARLEIELAPVSRTRRPGRTASRTSCAKRRCRGHRRRPGRLHRLDAARPAGLPRAAVRARALPAVPHRRVADPRDLLGAEAAEHAAEDAAEPLRQEVQRAVRQRRGASCRRRSTSGTTSRTSARRPGRWCAASSTR